VKPNLPVLGPKLGKELGAVRAALEAGDFEELDGGRFRVNGYELGPDEVLVERHGKEGWAVAAEDGLTVALDLSLDPELELEGRVRDLIHSVNALRRELGFEITDRIVLTVVPRTRTTCLRTRPDQRRDACRQRRPVATRCGSKGPAGRKPVTGVVVTGFSRSTRRGPQGQVESHAVRIAQCKEGIPPVCTSQ
jgi:hypothetical protein